MSGTRITSILTAGLLALVAPSLAQAAVPPDPLPPPVADVPAPVAGDLGPDVDGDGYDDLVIGVPQDGGIEGAATVAPGGPRGPRARVSELWSQQTRGVVGRAGGMFGSAHTYGDFDGDGFDDLAFGVPNDTDHGGMDNGAVNVLYGSPGGVTAKGDQRWSQASPGIEGDPGGIECFGAALAAGDFDADGYDDLLVGVTRDKNRFVPAAHVLYGSVDGLTADRSGYWTWPGGSDQRSPYDGLDLAAGDFDADGDDDAAWGISTHRDDEGGVHLLLGTPNGLVLQPGDPLSQSTDGVEGTAREGEQFGAWLAADDYDGDGFADLAVAIPYDRTGVGRQVTRTVQVFSGGAQGVSTETQVFDQEDLGVSHQAGAYEDYRALRLASGDIDSDGFAELVVGFPFADVHVDGTEVIAAGVVAVLPGSLAGPDVLDATLWDQQSPGVDDVSEPFDHFGSSMSVADLNGDGYGDLSIGVPGESFDAYSAAGAANVLFGAAEGLKGGHSQLWSQVKPFVENLAESYESFGSM